MSFLAGESVRTAATTGGLGLLGKLGGALLKLLPFQSEMAGAFLTGLIPAFLLGRLERCNYRDPSGFRARFYQAAFRKGPVFAAGTMLLVFLVVSWTSATWGEGAFNRAAGLLCFALLIPLIRLLKINRGRFVVGHIAATCTLLVGMLGAGFGKLPDPLFSLFFAGFFACLASAFPFFWRRCSVLTLSQDGGVRAALGGADQRVLEELNEDLLEGPELEAGVSNAVRIAWEHFRNGELPGAEQVLGQQPEAAIFVRNPQKTLRWRQGLMVFAAVMLAAMAGLQWYQDRYHPRQFRHLKPLAATEAEVRSTLARLEKSRTDEPLAWRIMDALPSVTVTMPSKELFTEAAWRNAAARLWDESQLRPGFGRCYLIVPSGKRSVNSPVT
jgi:hypothetical protein